MRAIALMLASGVLFIWDGAHAMDEESEKNGDGQTMKKNAINQLEELSTKIMDAIRTIEGILDEYGIEKTAIAFNGGKDSTLLLHLVRICVTKKFGPDTQINAFFIRSEDEFKDLIHFVHKMALIYKLNLIELPGQMKHSLAQYKERQPHIVAALMGTRSTDPIGKYMRSKIQWSDQGWPQFLRVCPLFDWSYCDVWKGIRGLSISYCNLYDEGYSSLGECSKTTKNSALIIEGSEHRYKPASSLNDGNLERANRDQE
uniref:FAD synthase n=1 Tax=Globodera rostochiensis TaxID=31243 RepID=A0A914HKA6_GLORO